MSIPMSPWTTIERSPPGCSSNGYYGDVSVGSQRIRVEGEASARTAVAQPAPWPFDPPDGRQYAWSEPEHLGPGVNSPADEMLWGIADDELTIYFSRSGDGLFVSRRESRDVPFPAPSPRLLEGKQFVGAVTADGLIAVHATPAERRQESIHITTRQSADQPFGDAALMDPPVNTGEHTQHPVLSADGLTLLVTSTRAGSEWGDVWMFTRAARDQPFADPVRLPEPINTPAWEMPAFISNDRTLLIASTQIGTRGAMKRVFRYFTRQDQAGPFGPAQPMDLPLGAAEGVPHNGGFRLSGDGRNVYFHTPKLPGVLGRKDIYVSRRVPVAGGAPAANADRAAALALAPHANTVTVRLPSGQLASVGRGQGAMLPEGPFDLVRLDFSAFHAPAGYISDVFLPAIEPLPHLEEITTFHETAFTTQELTRLATFPCRGTLTKFGAGYLDLNAANLDVLKDFPRLTYLGLRAARGDAALFDRIRQEHPGLRAMSLSDLGTEQPLDEAAQDALARLPLEDLMLLHYGVIDRRLCQRLATMPDLRRLSIVVTTFTDEQAVELMACPKLEHLMLAFTAVGDKTLESFASFQTLRHLNVYMTKATVPGMRKLSESLPRCEIFSDQITIPPRQ
jgi:hypothetical protein